MAIKKISDLQKFTSISDNDFVLVINTGTRTPKKIAVSDLVRVDKENLLSRYDFQRSDLSGFGQSSLSFEAKNLESDLIYNIPESITFSGFSETSLNNTFSLSGIKNDNFAWSTGVFSIEKSGLNSHWTLNSGEETLFQFSRGKAYPEFGPINASGSATSESVTCIQTKTQATPILFSKAAAQITGFFEVTSTLPVLPYESAGVSYNYSASFSPSSNSGDLTFSGANDLFSFIGQKKSPISIVSGTTTGQTIFTLEVSGFSVNDVSEYFSGDLGNFNFKQTFTNDFSLLNSAKITGAILDDSNTLQNYKPQLSNHSLDINNDGFVSSQDDVLLLQRYFNGLVGNDLISGLSFASGTRSGAAEIQNFIQSGIDLNSYDVNEDGIVGADDINFILNFSSGLSLPLSGRNGMKEAHLKNNLNDLFNI